MIIVCILCMHIAYHFYDKLSCTSSSGAQAHKLRILTFQVGVSVL